MNTTFSTTGLALTTGSTRRVFSLFSLFRSYWGAFQEWRKRERLRADLCGLNDREPQNIGITRGELDYVAIADIAMLLRHVRLVLPITDISLGGHSVKTCLALPSDPSYNNLWVGLRPWCKSGQSGSSAGCRRYWPPTWLAIRDLCIATKSLRMPN